jgi:hypothetical protein
MGDLWRIVGALCASAASFAAVFAFAFWVTSGSAWMLAFLPLFMASVVVPPILVLRNLFDGEERGES